MQVSSIIDSMMGNKNSYREFECWDVKHQMYHSIDVIS